MKLGTNEIVKAYLGSNVIDKIYLGSNSVFSNNVTPSIDDNTKLLLHFNGNYNDSSLYSQGCTAQKNGSSTITYLDSVNGATKFNQFIHGVGTESLNYNNTEYANITSDYTIDYWFYCISNPTANDQINPSIIREGIGWDSFAIDASQNCFWLSLASLTSGWIKLPIGETIQRNKFHHVAITYKMSTHTFSFYLDGIKKAVVSDYNVDMTGGSASISLSAGGSNNANWYVDEFRISNIVRWNDDFTPPTQPYN